MNNITYVLRQGVLGVWRNLTMSIALIITTAISLALVGAGILVSQMTADTRELYLERVEVSVELNEDISAHDPVCASEACRQVFDALDGAEGIDSVIFRSQEESYNRYVELFSETDPELVRQTSPDALPATLNVRLSDPTDVTPLDPIRGMEQVTAINDQSEHVALATDNLDSIRAATFILAIVQAVAAIFLIINMVQISAFQRREETSLMRVVGASRWFTQAPFVIEVTLASFIGVILALGGMFAAKNYVIDPALAGLYNSMLLAPITNADVLMVMPWVGLVGLVFASLAAYITLRAYVRR